MLGTYDCQACQGCSTLGSKPPTCNGSFHCAYKDIEAGLYQPIQQQTVINQSNDKKDESDANQKKK